MTSLVSKKFSTQFADKVVGKISKIVGVELEREPTVYEKAISEIRSLKKAIRQKFRF